MGQFGKVWMTAGLLFFLNIPLFLFSQTFHTDIINDQINWELRLIEAEWTWGTTDILDPDATPVFGDVPDHEPSFLLSAAASSNAVPDQVNAGNICIQWNGVPTTTYSGNILIKTQLNTSYAGIDVDYRSWEDDAGARCSLDSEDDDFMRIQKYYSLGISSPIGGLWTLAPETFSNGSSSTVRYYWHYANGNTLDNPLNFGTLDGFVDHVNTNAGAPSGLSNAANFAYSSQYSGPNYQSSADVIYQFTIDEPRSVTISTNNPTTNFDTYIHLLDASNNYITSNNNASGTTKSTIAGKRLCSGTYKVVVEGNGGSTGTFSLNISLGSIPPFNGGTIVEPAYTVMQQGQSLPTLLNDALPATTVDVSYTWELSQDGGAWTTIPHAVGTSLDPGPFVGCSMSFRRKAYFCTDDMAAYSNTVTFTKITDLSGGTIASEGSLFACTNGKLPNIVSVTPANLNFATYRWQYHLGGNWQVLNGETGLNLTTGTLPGSTPIYYRRVATICGQDYPSNVITFRKYLSTDTDRPIYVNDNASGSNNGSSWANAYTQLQYAIDEAECTGAPVWVAAGTYQPTVGVTGSDFGRNNTFFITEDIEVYGGFAGNESSLEQRDYTLNRTILSGDFSQNDIAGLTQDALISNSNRQDNAFHVMTLYQVSSSCIVDGLEFTGGNFNFNPSADNIGGGAILIIGSTLAATPLIRNCSFYDNSSFEFGGAVFNQSVNSNANPIFTNCTFDNNWASISGGAIANQANKPDGASNSSPTFEYCRFTGNGAAEKGGAIYNDPVNANSISSPSITNCVFTGNVAGEHGGAVHNSGISGESTPSIVNSVFYGNTAAYRGGAIYNVVNTLNGNTEITNCSFYNNTVSVQGGAIYNVSGAGNSAPSLLITNTILWNNGAQEQFPLRNSGFGKTIVNYSIFDDGTIDNGSPSLPGSTTGSNNLDSDPLFVDPANGDFRLQLSSPGINAGDNSAIPVGVSTDLDGNNRVVGIIVDMGAYENTTPLAPFECATILDFEAPATTTAFQYFANDNLSDQPTPTIANPAPDATNASGTVLAFTKTAAGQTFAGTFPHPDPSRSLDFTDANQLCVKVLMDHPGNITLKLEYSSTGGGNWIQTVENTVINEWVELCFDVSANSLEAPFEAAVGHNYYRVTLFPDFGFPGTGVDVTTYFDDIKVCNSSDGLCGDENLDVGGGDLTSGTYRGEITLTSANTIVEGPVVFTAGQSITLQAGFHAGPGLAFHARIEDCIPAPNPNILEEIEVPNERRLLPGQLEMAVYPNPSSFETNIAFHLSASGRTSLEVYHSTGTLLQRLLDQEVMEAGEYTRQLQTTAWESGMYLVVLRSAGSTLVKKIMVIR